MDVSVVTVLWLWQRWYRKAYLFDCFNKSSGNVEKACDISRPTVEYFGNREIYQQDLILQSFVQSCRLSIQTEVEFTCQKNDVLAHRCWLWRRSRTHAAPIWFGDFGLQLKHRAFTEARPIKTLPKCAALEVSGEAAIDGSRSADLIPASDVPNFDSDCNRVASRWRRIMSGHRCLFD